MKRADKLALPADPASANKIQRRLAVAVIVATYFVTGWFSAAVRAAPRQEDVFRSIQDNLGDSADPTRLLGVLLALVALVVLVMIFNKARQREAVRKPLNHQGKLLREMQKQMSMKPAEMRQLRTLAEGQPVENPLTLLLCPSLLVKAAKESPDKFDRRIVAAMVKRLGG